MNGNQNVKEFISVIKHFVKITAIATIAFIMYAQGIRDSTGLTTVIIVAFALAYGIPALIKRFGFTTIVDRSVELVAPPPMPELGIAPPDLSSRRPVPEYDPNHVLYDPNAYYEQFLNPANKQPVGTGVYQSLPLANPGTPSYTASPYDGQATGQAIVPLHQQTTAFQMPPGSVGRERDASRGSASGYDPTAILQAAQAAHQTPLPTDMTQLVLGPQAYIHLWNMYVNTVIVEQPKRGRENICRVIVEEFGRLHVPVLFVDVSGSYTSLVSEWPSAHIAMSPQPVKPLNSEFQAPTFALSKDDAIRMGQAILQQGWQLLFKFDSYASSIEAAEILILLLQGMDSWQVQRRASVGVLNSIVVLTEAQRLLPDDPMHCIVAGERNARMLREHLLAQMGSQGSMGLHVYLVTRKVSGMDRETLMQCPVWLSRGISVQEAQWASRYTQVPPGHIMIPPELGFACDVRTHETFTIRYRDSRSFHEEAALSEANFAFPLLSSPVTTPQENQPPFPQR